MVLAEISAEALETSRAEFLIFAITVAMVSRRPLTPEQSDFDLAGLAVERDALGEIVVLRAVDDRLHLLDGLLHQLRSP